MTHAELVTRADHWLWGKGCTVVTTEKAFETWEQPDAIGWKPSGTSHMIECKATRKDFLKDRKKWHRMLPGQGAYRWYMAPAGIIGLDDLPENWGLLVPAGKRVRIMRDAVPQIGRNAVEEVKQLVFVLSRLTVLASSRKRERAEVVAEFQPIT